MKKNFYTFLLLIICTISTNAQSVNDFEFSEIRKYKTIHMRETLPLKSGRTVIVKARGNKSVFVALMNNPKITFELLDENLNSLHEVKSDLVLRKYLSPTKKGYEFTEILNDKIYVFYSVVSDREFLTLYAAELNEKTLGLSGKPKQVAVFNKKNEYVRGDISIEYSNDKERIVIYMNEEVKDENKEKTRHLDMVMLDNNLDKIWQHSLFKPLDEKVSRYLDLVVSNDGELFVLENQSLPYNYRTRTKSLKPEYFINKIDSKGEAVRERKLRFEGKAVRSLRFDLSPDEKLWLVGRYISIKSSANDVGGLITMRYNKNSLRSELRKFPSIDLDFYLDGKLESFVSRVEKGLSKGRLQEMKFDIGDVIHKADGGITLLGEEHYYTRIEIYVWI